jgi:hypothetical protein
MRIPNSRAKFQLTARSVLLLIGHLFSGHSVAFG